MFVAREEEEDTRAEMFLKASTGPMEEFLHLKCEVKHHLVLRTSCEISFFWASSKKELLGIFFLKNFHIGFYKSK